MASIIPFADPSSASDAEKMPGKGAPFGCTVMHAIVGKSVGPLRQPGADPVWWILSA